MWGRTLCSVNLENLAPGIFVCGVVSLFEEIDWLKWEELLVYLWAFYSLSLVYFLGGEIPPCVILCLTIAFLPWVEIVLEGKRHEQPVCSSEFTPSDSSTYYEIFAIFSVCLSLYAHTHKRAYIQAHMCDLFSLKMVNIRFDFLLCLFNVVI